MKHQAKLADCPCDGDPAKAGLLDIDEVIERAARLARPVRETELAKLHHSRGRVLARQVCAPRPMPFFDNSAMDGFAVSSADLDGHGPFVLLKWGEAAAGGGADLQLAPGTCMPIYTGARLPAGSDAVIPVEMVEDLGAAVRFSERPVPGAHIRPAGSDIARNAVLVEAGTRITPRHANLLAANGYGAVNVYRRPRVAILSTGDELRDCDAPIAPGQLFDCNRPMLNMALEEAGCEVDDFGILPDDLNRTCAMLRELASDCDLIVSSGSVSVGGRDFLKPAFIDAGGTIEAWKVAVKPGKPVMIGRLSDAVFLGLPGNPYAAWIGFNLFGRPLVEILAGGKPVAMSSTQALAGERFPHKKGRREYVPARIKAGTDLNERPLLSRLGNGGSASLYSACMADGLAVIPADTGAVEPGQSIGFVPFDHGVL